MVQIKHMIRALAMTVPTVGRALLSVVILAFSSVTYADSTMPVSVARVVQIPISEEINLTGDLNARRTSRISSEVDGIVDELGVDDGTRVNANDTILILDDEIAEINKQTAAAAVLEAKARFNESKRQFLELEQLKEKKHVSHTAVAAARAELEVSEALLAQRTSELRRAATLLSKHTISAPFNGVVNRKLVEVGQWVDTNTALVELVETDFLRLEIPVPQFYFSKVKVGTRVKVRFDALPELVFETAISAVIPISDNAARTFPVRIELSNEAQQLAPGMSAKATLLIDEDQDSLSTVVPRDAVVRNTRGAESVWTVVDEDGVTKAVPQEITTGRSYRGVIEVVDNALSEGVLVVVRGNEILRPGQSISIADELAPDL